MSCGGQNQNFRLLDGFVGWDKAHCHGLDGLGFDDAGGLRLAQRNPKADTKGCASGDNDKYVPAGVVLAHILPPRLARGCGRCDWFLVHQSRLLRHDCCTQGWLPAWSAACDPQVLKDALAVAARGHRVAVSDAQAKRVWIWTGDGERLVGSINAENLIGYVDCDRPNRDNRIERVGPLAFTPWGELLVVDSGTNSIWRFGSTGEVRGKLPTVLPAVADGENIRNLQ